MTTGKTIALTRWTFVGKNSFSVRRELGFVSLRRTECDFLHFFFQSTRMDPRWQLNVLKTLDSDQIKNFPFLFIRFGMQIF